MTTVDDVTTIVVNYRTLEHPRACLESLRAAYPSLPVLVVDNGSQDESVGYIRAVAARNRNVEMILTSAISSTGPRSTRACARRRPRTRSCSTPTAWSSAAASSSLSSRLSRPTPCSTRSASAGGPIGWVTARLRKRSHEPPTFTPSPVCSTVGSTSPCPPFVHHGAPLHRNMWGARRKGYHLEHVTIEDDVTHLDKVTASVHGYGYDRWLRVQLMVHDVENKPWRLGATATGRPLVRPPLPPDRSPAPSRP